MERILTIVGRAKSEEDFLSAFQDVLPDNYQIHSIHNLGEFYEADEKERYLSLVGEEIVGEKSTMETVAKILFGKQLGAYIHNSLEDAMSFSKREYGLQDELEEKIVEHHEKLAEIREKFPFFTAEEVKKFKMFNAFYNNGDIIPFRCRFNDELAIALVSVANGHDEIQISPLGVLLTENMAEEFLSMPFEEE